MKFKQSTVSNNLQNKHKKQTPTTTETHSDKVNQVKSHCHQSENID